MSYWFRPKYYGYGATPSNWKGWLATVVLVLMIVGVRLAIKPVTPEAIAVTAALTIALLIVFAWVAKKKTNGPWRWRWGSDHNKD